MRGREGSGFKNGVTSSLMSPFIWLVGFLLFYFPNTLSAQTLAVTFTPAPPSSLVASSAATITATVTGYAPGQPDQGVDWSLTCSSKECGTLSLPHTASGVGVLYTAPSSAPKDSVQITVKATADSTKSQSVKMTIISGQSTGSDNSASSTLKNDFGFGIALGMSTNVTGPNIVTNATVDANGIVRVNTRANTTAGFMLETHYFPWPPAPKCDASGQCGADNRTWGMGPFVAAQPGSSHIIEAVGAGWMFGWRRPKGSKPTGFGLGLGYEAIPAAQVLGSEFVDGKPAPLGPNGQPLPIRYETQDKGALLAILSVTF